MTKKTANDIFIQDRIRFVTYQIQNMLLMAAKWQCLDPSFFTTYAVYIMNACNATIKNKKNRQTGRIRSTFYACQNKW
jgi:hypothetical protein